MKKYTILFFSLFLFSTPAIGANFLVVEGQILDPAGNPVEAASVDFVLEILDPGQSCVIYEETHATINMSGSKGMFSLRLGDGGTANNGTYTGAFDNSSPAIGCFPTGTYNPSPSDQRYLRISYDDGISGVQTLTQNIEIGASAYALNAQKIDGLTSSDLIQSNTTGSFVLTQTNVESVFDTANYTELLALLGGTSSQYLQSAPTAPFAMNNQRLTNLGTPSVGTDAANKDYVDQNLGQATVADFSGLGAGEDGHVLTWNNAASRWENSLPSANDSSKLPLDGSGIMGGALDMGAFDINNIGTVNTSGVFATDLSASNDLNVTNNAIISNDLSVLGTATFSGTLNATGAASAASINVTGTTTTVDLNVSNNAIVSNNISATGSVSANGLSTGTSLTLYNGANYVDLQAPAGAGNYTLTFPVTAPSANQILEFNGSTFQWSPMPGAGGITSINGQVGPAHTFNVGTAGPAPTFSSVSDTHTLDIPYASGGGVTAGLISNTEYVTFSNALSAVAGSALGDGDIWVGNASNQAGAVTISGDATLNNAGVLNIVTNAIDGVKLNDGAVDSVHIMANAVNNSHINLGAIDNSHINNTANIDATKLGTGMVDNTEFDALDGIAGNIQTELNNKLTPGAHPGPWTLGSSDNDFGIEAHGAVKVNVANNVTEMNTMTGGLRLPMGGVGQRGPAAADGYIRYNTDNQKFEGYENGAWVDFIQAPPGNIAFSDATNGGLPLDLGTSDPNHVRFFANGVEHMRIHHASGFVGIGTTNPGHKLHVEGNAFIRDGIVGDNAAGFVVANNNDLVLHYNQSGGSNVLRIEEGSAPNLRMIINDLGKVGIGTTNPQARLDVNGGVKVGYDSACSLASHEGKLRWDTGQLEVCDGTDWHTLSDDCPSGWDLVGDPGEKGSICVSPTQGSVHYLNATSQCGTLNSNNYRASVCSQDQLKRYEMSPHTLGGPHMTRNLISATSVITVNGTGDPNGASANLNAEVHPFRCCIE